MEWLTGIGIPALWLFIGFRFAAPIYVKRFVEHHVRTWPILSRTVEDMQRWRREAAYIAIGIAIVWPVYLGWVGLSKVIPKYILKNSPMTDHEIRLQNEELKKRLADLEAEDWLYRELHK